MKKILLLSLGIILTTLAWSQTQPASGKKDKKAEKRDRINALLKMEEEGEMIFNKHNIFGIKLNTDGWGISFEKGKFQTPRKTRLLQFEFNENKHPKEDKDAGSIDRTFCSACANKCVNFIDKENDVTASFDLLKYLL